MPWHSICLSANGDIKPCCQFTNKGRPPNTEHPTIMENWNSQRMQDLRQAFLNGEKNQQIVIAVGNVKHRLDTADVSGLTRSSENILQSLLLI